MKKLLKVICVFIAALAISFAPIMVNNASADLPKDDTEACASVSVLSFILVIFLSPLLAILVRLQKQKAQLLAH